MYVVFWAPLVGCTYYLSVEVVQSQGSKSEHNCPSKGPVRLRIMLEIHKILKQLQSEIHFEAYACGANILVPITWTPTAFTTMAQSLQRFAQNAIMLHTLGGPGYYTILYHTTLYHYSILYYTVGPLQYMKCLSLRASLSTPPLPIQVR